ncbi:12015_t:CDS:2, partial [Acaulospora morrowiae]
MVHGKVVSSRKFLAPAKESLLDYTEEGESSSTSIPNDTDEKSFPSSEYDSEFIQPQDEPFETSDGMETDVNHLPISDVKEIDKVILDGKIVVKVDRPWKCNHEGCDKAFKVKSNLKRHQISHTELRPFNCPVPGC